MYPVIFAATEHAAEAKPGFFEALGINWTLLVLQTLAFLLLVAVLRKYVYPTLIKSIDDRQASIDKTARDAEATHEALEKAEIKADELMKQARDKANGIIGQSQADAATLVSEAEDRARERAEQMIDDARNQLDADIAKARLVLKQDAARLVAQATGKLLHEKVDNKRDAQLIERALKAEEAA